MQKLIKSIRRRFGISAPRMTVRTHVAWYWRWLGYTLFAAVSLALAAWMYDAGRRFAGFDQSEVQEELARLRSTVTRLESESAELHAVANAADARVKIEQSAQEQLTAQLKALVDENTRLKEDLAFFEGLVPGERRDDRISIHRFKVERGGLPGEFRYRLLVLQGGRRDREFQGTIQLVAELQDKGRSDMITIAEDGAPAGMTRRLNFKFFQRQEGTFKVSPTARVRSVEVKVFENGNAESRASESVKLP
jgi:hypothetical protein